MNINCKCIIIYLFSLLKYKLLTACPISFTRRHYSPCNKTLFKLTTVFVTLQIIKMRYVTACVLFLKRFNETIKSKKLIYNTNVANTPN